MARKAEDGTGSIVAYTTKDGSKRYAVYLTIMDPQTGAKRRTTKRGFATQEAAVDWRAEHAIKAKRGQYARPSALTVGQYLDEWLDTADLRPTTLAGYRTKIKRHVKPYIGTKRLDSLTAGDLNALYRKLIKGGRADHRAGEGLSLTSVKQVQAILSGAFKQAVKDRRLLHNPCADVTMPKPKDDGKGNLGHELTTWTAAELARFLNVTEGERYAALWYFLAMAGCRRGEALGLRWSDVDLDHATVTIRRTITVASDGNGTKPVMIGKTKSGKPRVVELDAGTVDVLKAHRKRQAEERLAAGERWQDEGLVFPRDAYRLPPDEHAGRPLHPERISRYFKARVAAHDLPEIRLHDLRHTWATLALKGGVPARVVQERLGHADIKVTMNTYSHVMPGMQRGAAETVAGLLKLTG